MLECSFAKIYPGDPEVGYNGEVECYTGGDCQAVSFEDISLCHAAEKTNYCCPDCLTSDAAPRMLEKPDGDWFCPSCKNIVSARDVPNFIDDCVKAMAETCEDYPRLQKDEWESREEIRRLQSELNEKEIELKTLKRRNAELLEEYQKERRKKPPYLPMYIPNLKSSA